MTPHTCSGAGSFSYSHNACSKINTTGDRNGCAIKPFLTEAENLYETGEAVDTTRGTFAFEGL